MLKKNVFDIFARNDLYLNRAERRRSRGKHSQLISRIEISIYLCGRMKEYLDGREAASGYNERWTSELCVCERSNRKHQLLKGDGHGCTRCV